MPKIEARLSEEEKAFFTAYREVKEYSESGLVRYALKRLCTTNAVKGLNIPDSLKTEKHVTNGG